MNKDIELILKDITDEFLRATKMFSSFSNHFEGWAVLQEEVDELWEEIRKKREKRSYERLRNESIQVAAMTLRYMIDILYLGSNKGDAVCIEDIFNKCILNSYITEIKNCHEGYARIKFYMNNLLVCTSLLDDAHDFAEGLLNLMVFFIRMVDTQYKK